MLWDLDGTLANTAVDIALTVNEMLVQSGLHPLDPTAILAMIGAGARNLVDQAIRAAGATPEPAHLERFLAAYRAHPRRVAELYPGIRELLACIEVPQGVVTNKPEGIARDLLAALGVAAHFAVVVGGDTLPVRKPDGAPIRAAMRALGSEHAVLVGDGPHDVGASRAAGIACIGVTWGIGSPQGADTVVDDVWALRQALAARGTCRYRTA